MNNLNIIQSKILDWENLKSNLARWRFKNQKIVFTNGCFDIIHRGHIEYMAQAADLGDVLIVGLNSDASVKMFKEKPRPIIDQNSRAMTLASLRFIDAIVLFDEKTPYELIKKIQPDILVKGKDYQEEDIVGADVVQAKDGQIETLELVDDYSTSKIIEKIRSI